MGEERDADDADGGADSASGPTTDRQTSCAECGTSIETSDWYPIRTDRDDEGDLRLYPFCSEDCQAAWIETRDE